MLANRLRKTEAFALSVDQYAAGPRKISHAITKVRDCINLIGPSAPGCAIIQTDFVSAYDFLCLKWTMRVLRKKGVSEHFVSTLENVYSNNQSFVINIINNEQQAPIENKRKAIFQGDRTSTILFNFSIDPLLVHLKNRLKGLAYFKMTTAGPHHPLFGRPTPASAKLKMLGYVDDLKALVTSKNEFIVLDNSLTLKKALDSMMETGVRACPLWDNLKQEYVGMLTITDFIRFTGKSLHVRG